jgi:hypothetical protein
MGAAPAARTAAQLEYDGAGPSAMPVAAGGATAAASIGAAAGVTAAYFAAAASQLPAISS